MPTDNVARRARLRSIATGQGLQAARSAVHSLPPGASVVEVPTSAQAYLEGMVTLGLRYLHEDGELVEPAEPVQITKLDMTAQSICIHASQAGLARHMADRSCDPFEGADVSLRVRDSKGRVEFFQVGHPGSVVLSDFTYAAYVDLHRQRTEAHEPCLLTRPVDALDPDERESLLLYPRDKSSDWWAASSLLRRLRLLTVLEPAQVDIWATHGELKVECVYRELSETTARRLLDALASQHISPRWIPERERSGPLVDKLHYFTVEGASTKVQVRVFQW